MTFSQEMRSDKGDWIFSSQIGFASLEAEKVFKVTASAVEYSIGKEINISEPASFVISLEQLKITTDYKDPGGDQIYLNNSLITIPIIYQRETFKDQPVSFLSGIGFYGSYQFRSKLENVSENSVFEQNGLGWNFGLQLNFDAVLELNKKLAVLIGMKTKSDVLSANRTSVQNYKVTNFYALRFGLKWNPEG
ncbi:MAG: hypothetical protein KJO77_02585 [Bacteroidia bacterium]|nr:hypothetical protein [Bacteroidia bacterium]NND53023.1 hypothetical protein [Flavobacteriaceae bacterium]